ncbi:Biotin synthesis protein BioH [hydrothermal vent metagenome]|uniref:Biotin synthesis protein BioH n=1 Tax=hydrothermal vent metagenome TaxID=652676 RepID=A0A3B1BTB9_9ZZZZ
MSKILHVVVRGEGPDLVFVHGWAMHGGIWPEQLLLELEKNFRLHIVDLPGHGHSAALSEVFSLATVSAELHDYASAHLQASAIWLGWSLGGMLVSNMAVLYPQQVAKLVIVSSSLCFCKTDGWPDAMDAKVLALFAEQLGKDYRSTLSRFLALQFKGDSHAREGLRCLRDHLFARSEPDSESLSAGLKILQDEDLRWQVVKIEQPVYLIGGENDSLTPVAALQNIAAQFARVELSIIKGAGHAPFISHQQIFQQQLMTFLYA